MLFGMQKCHTELLLCMQRMESKHIFDIMRGVAALKDQSGSLMALVLDHVAEVSKQELNCILH